MHKSPGSSNVNFSFLPGFQKRGPWGQQASVLTCTLKRCLHQNFGLPGNNHGGKKPDAIGSTVPIAHGVHTSAAQTQTFEHPARDFTVASNRDEERWETWVPRNPHIRIQLKVGGQILGLLRLCSAGQKTERPNFGLGSHEPGCVLRRVPGTSGAPLPGRRALVPGVSRMEGAELRGRKRPG